MELMKYYFSASTIALYREDYKARYIAAGSWPDDVVEITVDEYNEFSSATPDGKLLAANSDGKPEWANVPIEDIIAAAENRKQELINSALQSISIIQLKMQAGRKLTDEEIHKLNITLDYIDAVTATDTSTAPDISWPVPPEV